MAIDVLAAGWIMMGMAILLYLIAIIASVNNKHRIINFALVISIICSASAVVLFTITIIKVIEKL